MNMPKRSFLSMGLPSIFTIFSVLCLVILSLLSLGTSRSDLNTGKASLEQTSAYYEACTSATELYLEFSALAEETAQNTSTEKAYLSAMKKALTDREYTNWNPEAGQICLTIPYSKKMALCIIINAAYSSKNTEDFTKLLMWKTVNTASWTPDTKQPVFKGDFQ